MLANEQWILPMLRIKKRFGIGIEAIVLVALSLLAGTVVNALLPNGIPLMEVRAETPGGMSVKDAMRLHGQGVVFVDARDAGPYAKARIPGAVNIPPGMFMDEIESRLDGVARDQVLVIYCSTETCPLSEQLAQSLQLMGYTDVRVFGPGMEAWKLAGGPVEEG
jgi:rhodanese-related sulfurtransferase